MVQRERERDRGRRREEEGEGGGGGGWCAGMSSFTPQLFIAALLLPPIVDMRRHMTVGAADLQFVFC